MKDATPPKKLYVETLPAPPAGATYALLLSVLRKEGVRPPLAADRAKQRGGGERAKPGDRWRNKTLGWAVGLGEKQIQRYCSGVWLPPSATHFVLMAAIFGSDASDYPEWRRAMQDAWEREANSKPAGNTVLPPTSDLPAGPATPKVNPIPIVPVRVPVHFFSREEKIEAIHKLLLAFPHRVAVHGINGVGKTLLAAAYAHKYHSKYRNIVWIEAETDEGCINALTMMSVPLDQPSASRPNDIASALNQLTRSGDGILLVYDNARTARELAPFLPGGKDVHILITSNSPNWRAEATPFELAAWTPEEGADFLERRLGASNEREAAVALTEQLGGLPIALELAASFCERRVLSLSRYMALFASAPVQHLSQSAHLPPNYRRPLATAFSMSLASAIAESPHAGRILEFTSLLAPEPVPLCLIDQAWPLITSENSKVPSEAVDEAIAALRNHSLLSLTKYFMGETREDGSDCVLIHRLVQHITLDRIADLNTLFVKACEAMGQTYPLTWAAPQLRQYVLAPHFDPLLSRHEKPLDALPLVCRFWIAAHTSDAFMRHLRGDMERAFTSWDFAFDLAKTSDYPDKEEMLQWRAKDMHLACAVLDIDDSKYSPYWRAYMDNWQKLRDQK